MRKEISLRSGGRYWSRISNLFKKTVLIRMRPAYLLLFVRILAT